MSFRLQRAYVEYIHDELVSVHMPFDEPIDPADHKDLALLDSAVNRPFHTFQGEYLFPTLHKQAAALFHALVCNHCFKNGNKRTALLALDLFLTSNDCFLLMNNDEAYRMAIATAEANMRNVSPEDALKTIEKSISESSVLLEELTVQTFPDVASEIIGRAREHVTTVRGGVRTDPRNLPG